MAAVVTPVTVDRLARPVKAGARTRWAAAAGCAIVTGMATDDIGRASRAGADALLVDLDGVVRHFDPAFVADLERRHGLAAGAILAAAFEEELLARVTTGRITRAEWVATVGSAIGDPEAAEAWGSMPASVDEQVLGIVDDVRAAGGPVAVLTNGTDTIPAELAALGITDRFDAVFNSAEIGHTKPDARAFAHACEALGLPPGRVAFTDDSPAKLAGAVALGMPAHHFTGAPDLRAWLVDLQVLVG